MLIKHCSSSVFLQFPFKIIQLNIKLLLYKSSNHAIINLTNKRGNKPKGAINMYYGDKRKAKVQIMSELVEKGWKVFGFSPDQSDAWTDYYHPASWDGVASKNGYVLLVDVGSYGVSYSGKEVREYNYSKNVVSNDRIKKLESMMNDEASTENEKASCATLIQKEKEKVAVEEYTVLEVFPTFTHTNPKGTSWHIEKDGQIIAKGKGVFSTNTYDYKSDVSSSEQKNKKIISFVERIEKVLNNSDALQAEVIKVEKKVIKPVEKADKTINVNDVLSFSYHGHFWVVTDVYQNSKDQTCVTYELLGSAKRGYQRLNGKSVKRYYQTLNELTQGINEGKVNIYTLEEVAEYQEKTVFKKTARKQTVSNAPQIETTEEAVVKEVKQETAAINEEATVNFNEEQNGIELTFSAIPSVETREELKANGFRWSKRGFWYAKQNNKTLTFVKQFEKSEVITEEVEEVQSNTVTEEQSNVIYHDFKIEVEQEEENNINMNNLVNDDLLSMFDDIEIENNSRIENNDLTFCQDQENIYNKLVDVYSNLAEQLVKVEAMAKEHNAKFNVNNNSYIYDTAYSESLKERDIEDKINNMKERYISKVCHYFQTKYNVTIDYAAIQKKYKDTKELSYDTIIDEIFIQLDGFSFIEKAEKEMKDKLKNDIRYSSTKAKSNKVILGDFVSIDTWQKKWGSIEISYNSDSKIECLLNALQHFDNGNTVKNKHLKELYLTLTNKKNDDVFTKHELTLNKVKSIKVYQNGKIDIEFASTEYALKFAREYCGITNAA